MSDFKKLIVWEKSMSLVKLIYSFTLKLPPEEKFGLVSQIRRCAISIPSNIAEGSKRGTDKDYRQFLRISSGSAAELETQLLLVKNIYALSDDKIETELIEIQKMLGSLIKKLSANS